MYVQEALGLGWGFESPYTPLCDYSIRLLAYWSVK